VIFASIPFGFWQVPGIVKDCWIQVLMPFFF
jgi:hypothetical protein